MAHEMLGGHTLAKHVGKSEAYLRHRLATEPDLTAASTFYDRQTAENALTHALHDNGPRVRRWLSGRARSLGVRGSMPQPVGVVLYRSGTAPVEATGVKVLLRRAESMPAGFHVYTAMVIE